MRRAVAALALVAVLGAAGSASTYRVRRGDTLSAVARRLGVSVRALADANGIDDVHVIVEGARLRVPGSGTSAAGAARAAAPAAATRKATTYVVRTGDTLERIARRFGVSMSALAAANSVRSRNLVRIGDRLTIPAASAAAVATAPRGGRALPARLRERPDRLALMPVFDRWARTYGVPPDLLKAMTWVESGWQNRKVSSTGAVGIGQLMPDTVDFVAGVLIGSRLDPRVPEHNIRMSARFLRYLLDQSRGRADAALAAYYQGLRSVRERGVLGETRQYVAAVLAFRPNFR